MKKRLLDETVSKRLEDLTQIKPSKLKLLYRMNDYTRNIQSLQECLKDKSDIIAIIKTDQNKIIGGFCSCVLNQDNTNKKGKSFLFSLGLNMKFELKEKAEFSVKDNIAFGLCLGNRELVIFDGGNTCYTNIGDTDCQYETHGISNKEFNCDSQVSNDKMNKFTPKQIEIYTVNIGGKESKSKIIETEKERQIFCNIFNPNGIKLVYGKGINNANNNNMVENINCCFNYIILIKTKNEEKIGCFFTKTNEIDKNSFIFLINNWDVFNYNNDSKGSINISLDGIKLGDDLFITYQPNASYLSIGKSYYIKEDNSFVRKIYFEISEIEIYYTPNNINEPLLNNTNFSKLCSMFRFEKKQWSLLFKLSTEQKNGVLNKTLMKNKLNGHSNLLLLVKTDENKIFGGYSQAIINYGGNFIMNSESYLFSLDLNKKFSVKRDKIALRDNQYYGMCFGEEDLIIFGLYDKCYAGFGNNKSCYETKGVTRNEFIGGKREIIGIGVWYNTFTPIEIEVYEIK